MKIITQSVSGNSKILPKPSGTPVVVVSAGSSTQSSVAMVTRTGSSLTGNKFCIFMLPTKCGRGLYWNCLMPSVYVRSTAQS